MQSGSIYLVWILWAVVYFVGLGILNFIQPFTYLSDFIDWVFYGDEFVKTFVEQGRLTYPEAKDLYLKFNPTHTEIEYSSLIYQPYPYFRLTGEIMFLKSGFIATLCGYLEWIDIIIKELWLGFCVIAGFIAGVNVMRSRQKAGLNPVEELTMGMDKRRDD